MTLALIEGDPLDVWLGRLGMDKRAFAAAVEEYKATVKRNTLSVLAAQ